MNLLPLFLLCSICTAWYLCLVLPAFAEEEVRPTPAHDLMARFTTTFWKFLALVLS